MPVTSNIFAVSWTRPAAPPAPGGYTPFPFVTNRTPPKNHSGIAARPPFNANNPRAASFIDPMSGMEVFRITGNAGTAVMRNGNINTGLNFPRVLKAENAPPCFRAWNADSTLLTLVESKSRSGDPSNPCRGVIIDASGTHGASNPWQIIRASGQSNFGEIPITGWFWDPLNPLRAYASHSDGMYEWFPIGAPGQGVGSKRRLFTWPSGYTGLDTPRGGRARPSSDGLWYNATARRNSDGRWGGFRVNLLTGSTGPFVGNPDQPTDNNDRAIGRTSATGQWGVFEYQDLGQGRSTNNWRFYNMQNGAFVGQRNNVGGHEDWARVNGVDYNVTYRGDWRKINPVGAVVTRIADGSGDGINHVSCSNYNDTVENFGSPNGSGLTSGLRYCISSIQTPTSRRGIIGFRLGPNDDGVLRFIVNPRGTHSGNDSELHPHPSMRMEYVVFNSNWCEPGVVTDEGHVNSYVVIIPNAWRSPNNNGS